MKYLLYVCTIKPFKMKNIFAVVAVTLFIATVFFSSCQKKQEDRLAETWRLIRVDVDSTVSWYELWQFDGQNVHMLTRDAGGSNLDTIDIGTYTVDAGMSKTIVTMQDFGNSSFNGDWEILKLNKEILIMLNTTDGGWLYREFVIE